MRDYNDINYYNEECKQYYEKVNQSEEKAIGDAGEDKVLKYLQDRGYKVRESTAEEDATLHADLIVTTTVDVKNKRKFYLELKNHWGNKGWLFTGADYIIQVFHDSTYWGDEAYVYKRSDMVDYYNTHRGLFNIKYCTVQDDGSVLWELGRKRLSEMNFVKRIYL